ncbi:MAG: hypothetical protein ACR2J8_13335, partial [Thermomicrobiales bacterium]
YYIITLDQGANLSFKEPGKSGSKKMSGNAVVKLMDKLAPNGALRSRTCITLEEINWRLYRADYDEITQQWTLHCKVCSTNPDARPDTTEARGEVGEKLIEGTKVSGCVCGRCASCWRCPGQSSYGCSNNWYYNCPE